LPDARSLIGSVVVSTYLPNFTCAWRAVVKVEVDGNILGLEDFGNDAGQHFKPSTSGFAAHDGQ
jgi:hypothetical protein